MNYIEQYYRKIEEGNIVTSDKIRRTYKHLVEKIYDKKGPYRYDDKKAKFAIDFIEAFCTHSKGKWGGKPLVLELWLKAATAALFGFVDRKTGLREYRQLILIVARKNGKSTWAAGMALYLLVADGEAGPEIYSAATKRDQAKIIWTEVQRMVKKSPALNKHIKCLVGSIRCKFNDGVFEPLGSDSDKLDGLNVHGALIDELHAIKDKNIYDVLIDGMTAREQPICIITTTAGTVRENIFDLKYDECSQIVNGYGDPKGYHDETILPLVYELDRREEWTDETKWQKANPALGSVKDKDQLAQKVYQAQHNPLLVKNLLCKDFNIRETSSEAFLTFEQLNNEATYSLSDVRPRYAIGGVDLSATTDLTCATLLWCDESATNLYVKQMYWIPEDLFDKRVQEDRVPYDVWHKRGFVRKSPGNSIDYRLVVEWFREMQDKEDIYLYKVGYDSWSAKYFVVEMEDTFGQEVMEAVIQGKKTLSGPMKALAADLEANKINYDNNPVLKWCMANVAVDIDRNSNIQPTKTMNAKRRIDGFASLLDAYVAFERNREDYLNII